MPEDFSQVDGDGLNKAAILKAERKAAIEAAKVPSLDPRFPWRVEPFDPFFFGARDEWPPEAL